VKQNMISSLVVVLVALGLLNGWMLLQQPGMIFFPYRQLDAVPSDWGYAYQDVSVITDDRVRLHGWYIPRPQAQRVVLFFHGNAGNISHRGDSIAIFHRLGLNVFIFDYRGYGRSEGSPSEPGLYRDAAAAWRYLTETRGFDPGQIVLFGRSLGGAVAAQLAATQQPAALILESTLSSARDFARSVFPLLSRLVVVRYDFDTVASLARVHCPVLVIHSPADEIMPFALGEKVYAAAGEPKRLVKLQGDHNGGFLQSQPGYERQLDAFFKDLPGTVQGG
jgi:fermentation-respiration switch protein FrsA (DUF1100 family)